MSWHSEVPYLVYASNRVLNLALLIPLIRCQVVAQVLASSMFEQHLALWRSLPIDDDFGCFVALINSDERTDFPLSLRDSPKRKYGPKQNFCCY